MSIVKFDDVRAFEDVEQYILQADETLTALGYTEHSLPHVLHCAMVAGRWLTQLGYSEREADLARIAGYMHDIGNVVNRANHAQSGALIAFQLLTQMGMPADDVARVVAAIGHHDEKTAHPVNSIAAALILADKTDVRRSRVRNKETISHDIHDRVNYAVQKAAAKLNTDTRVLTLELEIDTEICSVMDYFEIFLDRMLLCKKASAFLDLQFRLDINGSTLT